MIKILGYKIPRELFHPHDSRAILIRRMFREALNQTNLLMAVMAVMVVVTVVMVNHRISYQEKNSQHQMRSQNQRHNQQYHGQ